MRRSRRGRSPRHESPQLARSGAADAADHFAGAGAVVATTAIAAAAAFALRTDVLAGARRAGDGFVAGRRPRAVRRPGIGARRLHARAASPTSSSLRLFI